MSDAPVQEQVAAPIAAPIAAQATDATMTDAPAAPAQEQAVAPVAAPTAEAVKTEEIKTENVKPESPEKERNNNQRGPKTFVKRENKSKFDPSVMQVTDDATLIRNQVRRWPYISVKAELIRYTG